MNWLLMKMYDMVLKRSWWKLQCFNQKLFNQISCEKIMNLQMCMTHNLNFSRLSLQSYGQNSHFNVISMERFEVYYRKEGGGFLLNPNHVNTMNPKANLQPKVGFICNNTYIIWFVHVTCLWGANDCHIILIPSQNLHMPFLPPKCTKLGSTPWFTFHYNFGNQQIVYPWYYLTSLRTCHLNIWLSCSHNLILNLHNVFKHNKCWIFCEDFQFWCHV
jgi:hypothetical protein